MDSIVGKGFFTISLNRFADPIIEALVWVAVKLALVKSIYVGFETIATS